MEISLLNSPLLSWDGILNYKDISKEKKFKYCSSYIKI